MATKKAGSVKLVDSVLVTNVSLTADVSGVLPIANGGTGTGTAAVGDLIVGAAGNTWAKKALGAALAVLRVNSGATDVEWWPVANVVRLTADNTAIAAAAPTTVLAVATLVQAVAVNEEWDVEWILHLIPSVTTDVYAFEVLPTAGTFTGRVSIRGQNGAPNTGAGVCKQLDVATAVITTASANAPGNSGSTTLPTTVVIRAQGKQTVAGGNLQVLLRAGTSAAASSGTATVKLQSQMTARRIA